MSNKLLKRLLKDCFEHLSVEAFYCNQKKEDICRVRVLVKRPDTMHHIGEETILKQQIATMEVLDQDVVFIRVGNYIRIDNNFYKIFEQPLKDASNMIWEIKSCLV